MYKCIFKRVVDFILSFMALLFLSPIIIMTTILLAFFNRGKPFFFQERPGKDERIFKIIKFKTMDDRKDADGNLLPDSERLTSFGRFVRKTSIDELPQLFNVLKGEMSLIGPRPLLIEYLSLYNERQKKRHHVKPGMTGWAQINGRNTIPWKDKFEYDVWYAENISFLFDLKIVILTIKKVLLRSDINKEGEATTEAFNGNN